MYKRLAHSRLMATSPLRRPFIGRIIFGVLLLLSTIGIISFLFLFVGESLMSEAMNAMWRSLLICSLASIPAVMFVRFLDRREQENEWLFIGILLLWGALISTGWSIIGNEIGTIYYEDWVDEIATAENLAPEDAESLIFLSAAVVAPVVEELFKGLAIFLLMWLIYAEFNSMRDGIIYGALIGLGFNLTEAAFYMVGGVIEGVEDPYMFQFVVRFALLGFGGHALYSALVGAGIGRARQTKNWIAKFYWIGLGLWTAIFAHAVNNSVIVIALPYLLDTLGYVDLDAAEISFAAVPPLVLWATYVSVTIFFQFIPMVFLFRALVRSGRWERQTILEQLQSESEDIISAAEFAALEKERMLGLRKIPGANRRLSRAMVNAQNKFALRKWSLKHDGKALVDDHHLQVWREEIIRLRAEF